jgi:transposase
MTNDKTHKRPKYSLEFKQGATKLVLEKGYSQQQAADHLGISQSALGRWVRAERKPSGKESATKKSCLNLADQDELIRLRKENEQLRMEREILKNHLPGNRVPMERNRQPLYSSDARTLAVCFLEVKSPRQKTWPMGSCGPNCGGASCDPV